MIYLDSAATTPVRREVLEAMWPFLTGEFGNASSHHSLGESAARALAGARASIAANLGCRTSEIVFTSGGTEADNLAVKGIALASPRGRHIVTTRIEHEAVLASCDFLQRHHGFEITYLPIDRQAMIDPADAKSALRPDTTLCSVMLANNEVGTIEPVAEIAAIARSMRIPIHTDAVQGAGVLDLDVRKLGVDALSISGHKLGAPKGVGALYLRGRLETVPVLHGGGQERGRRSGTENVAGAVALATALQLAEASRSERVLRLLRPSRSAYRRCACDRAGGHAHRPSLPSPAGKRILLLPWHQRRGRSAAARAARNHLLKRISMCSRKRSAVARPHRNGH